jgi:hypothetical protein
MNNYHKYYIWFRFELIMNNYHKYNGLSISLVNDNWSHNTINTDSSKHCWEIFSCGKLNGENPWDLVQHKIIPPLVSNKYKLTYRLMDRLNPLGCLLHSSCLFIINILQSLFFVHWYHALNLSHVFHARWSASLDFSELHTCSI